MIDESEIVKRRLNRETRIQLLLEKVVFILGCIVAALIIAACIFAELFD